MKKGFGYKIVILSGVATFGLMFLLIGYLYAKNQELRRYQQGVILSTQQLSPAPTLTSTPTLEPTPTARVVYKIVTPTGVSNQEKIKEIDEEIAKLKEELERQKEAAQEYLNGVGQIGGNAFLNPVVNSTFQNSLLIMQDLKNQISVLEQERRAYE